MYVSLFECDRQYACVRVCARGKDSKRGPPGGQGGGGRESLTLTEREREEGFSRVCMKSGREIARGKEELGRGVYGRRKGGWRKGEREGRGWEREGMGVPGEGSVDESIAV